MRKSVVFSVFFRDNGERICRARYEVQYHTDRRPCRIWRDGSAREYQQWCIRAVCVYQYMCAYQQHASLLECKQISEGAIFETSSRRVRDLWSVVVASIITATIGSEFIGISIKTTLVFSLVNESSFFVNSKRFWKSLLERARIVLAWI